jgi:2-dehydropantoate 2-reductase
MQCHDSTRELEMSCLDIAVIGAGAIGQSISLHLALAGHRITLVARNERLAQLRRDGVVRTRSQAAAVHAVDALDASRAYDLVCVTVLFDDLPAVVPQLQRSAARRIVTLFNVFDVDRLRSVLLDDSRLLLGFPAFVADVEPATGLLRTMTPSRWPQPTIVQNAAWAQVFTDAGIPAAVESDMPSWLKTHASVIATTGLALTESSHAGAGVTWSRARLFGAATMEALAVVRQQGNSVTPRALGWPNALVWAVLIFVVTRLGFLRATFANKTTAEPLSLVRQILAAQKPNHPRAVALEKILP